MNKYTLLINRKKTTDLGIRRLLSSLRKSEFISVKTGIEISIVTEVYSVALIQITIPIGMEETWPETILKSIPNDSWGTRQGYVATDWAIQVIKKGI